MKKVVVEPGCITCGVCEFIAPEVFKVTDVSHVKDGVMYEKNKQEIEDAIRLCPVNVIKVKNF